MLNLRWQPGVGKDTLEWDVEASAVEYHVYRQDPTSMGWTNFATCADGIDADRTDEQIVDATVPTAGTTLSYLITAEDSGGNEGTLGLARYVERSNFTPCP